MKTITNPANFKYPFLLLAFLLQGLMFGQDTGELLVKSYTSNSILEDNCSAGDLLISNLYLGDINGNPITASCTPGTNQTAYIYAVWEEKTSANRYSLKVSYDLVINGQFVTTENDCQYEFQGIPVDQELRVQSINYKCGDRIELKNIYVGWQNSNTKSCADAYSPSKCSFSAPGFVVDAPLVANFAFNNPCNSYVVMFTDKTTGGDIKNPYTYIWNFGDGTSSTSKNPSKVYPGPGTYNVTLTATDSEGVVDSQTYPVTVYPVLQGLKLTGSEVDCSEDTNGTITAYGTLGGLPPYTYSISPQPAGYSQNNNEFSNLLGGDYTVTVTDSRNCTVSASVTITIGDSQAPTITAPSDINVEGCGTAQITNGGLTSLPYSASATTISEAQFQTEGGIFSEDNVKSLTYQDSSTGTCPIVVTRTFTITDDCDRMATDSQIINIDDTTNPTFTVPVNITIECDESSDPSNTGNVSDEADNCSTELDATYSDSVAPGTCPQESVITRTWTLVDDCGNSVSKVQTITIQDSEAPTFDAPANITISCDQDNGDLDITGRPSNETDNCSSILKTTFNDVITPGSCVGEYTITRTFTVEDECGNSSSKNQVITVEDNEGPSFDAPANITISCDQNENDLTITGNVSNVSDNCGSTQTPTYNDVVTPGVCAGSYTITRTFSVLDECGNETTAVQTITVEDTQAPEYDVPAAITISCEQNETDLSLTGNVTNVSDNCGTPQAATYSDSVTSGSCPGSYTINRTFSVKDDCGNETTKVQVITVQDVQDPTFTVPSDVTIECDESSAPSNTGDVADEADNCSTELDATYSDLVAPGTCANESVITRTWTLVDECGNSVSKVQTITIEDSTAPVLTNPAQNASFECDGSGNTGAIQAWLDNNGGATATDNCGNITWTNTYGSEESDCSAPISVTFRATDACGNFVETTATYSIADTEDPVLTASASNMTVECDGNGNLNDLNTFLSSNGGAIATDDCSAVSWSNDFTGLSDGCGATGSAIVTFTAIDGCGNSVSTTATFTIEDTTAPTFDVPSNITLECDTDLSDLSLTGEVANLSDACSENIEVTYNDVRTDGDCPFNYTFARTFTATDECGNTTEKTQTITIQDTTVPTFSIPSNAVVECDTDLSDLSLTGEVTNLSDNCSSEISVEYSDEEVQGECPNEKIITRTFTIADECGNEATGVQTLTVVDTTPPTITTEAQTLSLDCSSEDNEGGLQEWLDSNGGAEAIDNCGSITWSNNYGGGATDCSNAIEVTFTATDQCGNSSSTTATYAVQDIVPPVIEVSSQTVTVECDGNGNQQDLQNFLNNNGGATATDDCSAVTWSNDFSGLSDLCGETGSAAVTFTAMDGCGNTASTIITFVIADTTPPTITGGGNISIECSETAEAAMEEWLATNGGATADDSCSEVTWSMETNGMSENCAATGSITAIFTATDACGNFSSLTATFEIRDTTSPTFTVPAPISVECDEDYTDLSVTGNVTDQADNCDTELEVMFVDSEPLPGSCANEFTITRTWTVMDSCGNTNSQTQTISVVDTTAPTFTAPVSLEVACEDDIDDLSLTGDVTDEADNCSTGLQATYSDEVSESECGDTIIRTWTLMDECGNTNTQTQTITVTDSTPPSFTVPVDITIECGQDPSDLTLVGDVTDESDNCATGIEASFEDSVEEGACPGETIITRTWTLADNCGNSVEQEQIISIEDNTPPALVGELESEISVACSDVPEIPELQFTDDCSEAVTVEFEETRDDVSETEYTLTREWTVSDDCANVEVYVQVINVDNTPQSVEAASARRCTTDLPFDLFEILAQNVPQGGIFTLRAGNGSINGSMFDPRTFDVGDYAIIYSVEDESSCATEYVLNINVNKECIVLPPPVCDDRSLIDISQAVTPNGDGINDVFEVGGFNPECGFVIEVMIFNRWGAKIYENNNYQNDWGAEASSASIGNSNTVPTGTYYYIINLRNSDFAPFSGPIYVGTK